MPKVLKAKLLVLYHVQALRPSLHRKSETWLRILKPSSYFHRTVCKLQPETGQLLENSLGSLKKKKAIRNTVKSHLVFFRTRREPASKSPTNIL